MKRKKYDYHLIIWWNNLEAEFSKYSKLHRNISFNRQARAFLLSKGIDYKHDYFTVVDHKARLEELIRIAKTPWLEDK